MYKVQPLKGDCLQVAGPDSYALQDLGLFEHLVGVTLGLRRFLLRFGLSIPFIPIP